MNNKRRFLNHSLVFGAAFLFQMSTNPAYAAGPMTTTVATPAPTTLPTSNATTPVPNAAIPTPNRPQLSIPTTPIINAKAYILIDANSGQVLAEQNADVRLAPASLTKIMTSYIVAEALRTGKIHPNDTVTISEKAWRTGGSKMFVKVGDQVPVQALIQGIIVQSGNDACVAMAEHIASTEDAFANLMNQQALLLGMKNTHFTDANGLPNPNHYTTARDMATLGRALINNYPEDYKWYSQKWFIFNGIKQPNRNRLLWRDPSVDGIKTGHTDDAGFCLVASAMRNNMRLISVVMGTASDAARADESSKLLNYGYRFYETHPLVTANNPVKAARVWFGDKKSVGAGSLQNLYVTVPMGQFNQLKTNVVINQPLKAPIAKGQVIGSIQAILDKKVIATQPLVALQADAEGGFFARTSDHIRLGVRQLLGGDKNA